MHLIKSGLDLRTCQSLGTTDLYTKSIYHLVNTLTSTESIHWDYNISKTDICIREKF